MFLKSADPPLVPLSIGLIPIMTLATRRHDFVGGVGGVLLRREKGRLLEQTPIVMHHDVESEEEEGGGRHHQSNSNHVPTSPPPSREEPSRQGELRCSGRQVETMC